MIKRIIAILSILILLIVAAVLYYLFVPPTPQVNWDKSSNAKFLTVGYAGEVDHNYIADVNIWGDGHIVWVNHKPGGRQVMEGYLSNEEMVGLIEKLINGGYFDDYRRLDWDLEFGDYLAVKLSNVNHSVSIDKHTGYDNQQVLDLVDFLRSGTGITGHEFIPASGYLTAYLIKELDDYPDDSTADYQWPVEEFGYGLHTVEWRQPDAGRAIAGKELEFAWEIVNHSKPLVESEGEVYWIAVVVPKVSY